MALTGELSDLSLAELIEFFCNQRKTGRLEVTYPQGPGYFYIQAGSVVHAELGRLRGIEAVYYALTMPNASFKFRATPSESERSINQPWTSVVLEGLRRMDEGIVPSNPFPEGKAAKPEITSPVEAETIVVQEVELESQPVAAKTVVSPVTEKTVPGVKTETAPAPPPVVTPRLTVVPVQQPAQAINAAPKMRLGSVFGAPPNEVPAEPQTLHTVTPRPQPQPLAASTPESKIVPAEAQTVSAITLPQPQPGAGAIPDPEPVAEKIMRPTKVEALPAPVTPLTRQGPVLPVSVPTVNLTDAEPKPASSLPLTVDTIIAPREDQVVYRSEDYSDRDEILTSETSQAAAMFQWQTQAEPWANKRSSGAVVAAVVLVLAVIGVPWGWYVHSKAAKPASAAKEAPAMPAPATEAPVANSAEVASQPVPAPPSSQPENATQPAATTPFTSEPTASENAVLALAAKRQQEARALRASEAAAAKPNAQAPSTRQPSTATGNDAAPKPSSGAAKSVTVQVTYDENGRVTQASGADATALRIARQKRFPPGKAGSATVTIPIN